MATKFVELDLAGIEEGRYLAECDKAFLQLQQEMINFRKKHGKKSKGAKGKLTMKIFLGCESDDVDYFSIKAHHEILVPTPPGHLSAAVAGDSQDDKACLFVKRSGSDDAPKQEKLCTDDGRLIDPVTGDVKAE